MFKKFQSPTSYQCIYIHRFTSHLVLDDLIHLASKVNTFTIDTQYRRIETNESKENDIPALIQIQFHAINQQPLILLVEVAFLKSKFTLRTRDEVKEKKIKELFKQILSSDHHIYAWGNPKKKLLPFLIYDLFTSHDLDEPHLHNVQYYFTQWYNVAYHPSISPRSRFILRLPNLQTSLFLVFNEWLDIDMQYASWNNGIDLDLKTYQRYNSLSICKNDNENFQKEIEYRQKMQLYALNNCFAISKLMFHILKQWPIPIVHHDQNSNLIYYNGRKVLQTNV